MSRFHVRCRKCGARRVLPKRPEKYARLPACMSCGKKSYRIDKWMQNRNTKKMACTCAGYVPFTRNPKTTVWELHRKGSPYCHYRADGTERMPGDADFKDALLEREQQQGEETEWDNAMQGESG